MADANQTASIHSLHDSQTSRRVLMIRPQNFRGNDQTQSSNYFQDTQTNEEGPGEVSVARRAVLEFDGLVSTLRGAGVEVIVVEDRLEPECPDALFPNNWISAHPDGKLVLYPMQAENRRRERRDDVVADLWALATGKDRKLIDLTRFEDEGKFLEGTGSLVLDRVDKLAFACLSNRTHPEVLAEFCRELGYESFAFHACDLQQRPIYHTNVVMSLGRRFAVACVDSIDVGERDAFRRAISASQRELIEITHAQMNAFAGNILEVGTAKGPTIVAMSQTAREALNESQRRRIEYLGGPIVSAPIPTIERFGGGSVRCMLAEIPNEL